ncbi:MAG: hypothetical protein ACPGZP_05760, partial [Panacagrimonas sp.]
EYRDQIYYALAEIELEERKRDLGIDYLEKSLRANVDNQRQKMKSFMRLADLFFEDKDYQHTADGDRECPDCARR